MADLAKLVARLSVESAQFTSGLNAATQKLNQFDRNVSNTANRISKSLNAIPKAAAGLLGGFAGAAGLQSILKQADAYKTLQGRLRLVTESSDQLAAVSDQLFAIAQRTRQPIEATAELYTRVAQNAKELGLTQQQLLGFTETVSQAFLVSGASAAESAGAIRQLTQALASGVFRGEEFNSVAEQGPRILTALTESLGVTRGELRKMAEDGKLTAGVVIKALQGSSAAIADEFSKLPTTLEQSFTKIKNDALKAFGQVDTSPLVNAIEDVRKSLSAPGASDGLIKPIQALTNALADAVRLGQQLAGPAITAAFAALSVAVGRYSASIATSVAAQAQQLYTSRQQAAVNVAASQSWAKLTASQVASTAATLKDTQATLAAIVAAREDAVVQLQVAQAHVAASKAHFAAASAVAAQTGNTIALTAAIANLGKAQMVASAATAQLATLGQQQARVQAQIAAATTANVAAQTRANAAAAASTAAIAAQGFAARAAAGGLAIFRGALTFLGGPIGAAVTGLSLLYFWFQKNKTASKDAAAAVKKSVFELAEEVDRMAAGLPGLTDEQKESIEEAKRSIANLNAGYVELAKTHDLLKSKGDVVGAERVAQEMQRVQAEIKRTAEAIQKLSKASEIPDFKPLPLPDGEKEKKKAKDLTDAWGVALDAAQSIQEEIERMEQGRKDTESRQGDLSLDSASAIEDEIKAMQEAEEEKTRIAEEEARARYEIQQQYLDAASTAFGDAAYAARAFGKEGFQAFKAFAIAQTVIDTYRAATAAYASLAAIPVVGPGLGVAAAAAAVAAGLANVAKIRAAEPSGYMEGGFTGNGPTNEVAGVVHRGEYVVSNDAVKKLDELNFGHNWQPSEYGPQFQIVNNAPGITITPFGNMLRVDMIPELLEMVDSDQERRTTTGLGRNFRATASKLGAQPSSGR